MTRLTRYLVLLAGVALAMLVSVPAASAFTSVNPPPPPPKDKPVRVEKCADQHKKWEDSNKEWNKDDKEVKPILKPGQDPVALVSELKKIKTPTPDELKKITVLDKWESDWKKSDTDKRDWDKCKRDKHEDTTDTSQESADTSQIGDVPVGAVNTGGGPE
jgi:hypothetical protein